MVSAFAQSTLAAGSPLQSLYLIQTNPAQLWRAFAALPVWPMPNGPQLPPAPSGVVAQWRQTLAMLLAQPTQHDRAVLCQLGDLLASRFGQLAAAHVCYLLADEPPAGDPTARVLVLGGDHRSSGIRPARGDLLALQRTEILEFARTKHAANWGPTAADASLATPHPFWQSSVACQGVVPASFYLKLIYAGWLCDLGETDRALAYVDYLATASKALAKLKTAPGAVKVPGGEWLQSCVAALDDRLRTHLNRAATVGVGAKVVSSVFSLFDRGVNFLINGTAAKSSAAAGVSPVKKSVTPSVTPAAMQLPPQSQLPPQPPAPQMHAPPPPAMYPSHAHPHHLPPAQPYPQPQPQPYPPAYAAPPPPSHPHVVHPSHAMAHGGAVPPAAPSFAAPAPAPAPATPLPLQPMAHSYPSTPAPPPAQPPTQPPMPAPATAPTGPAGGAARKGTMTVNPAAVTAALSNPNEFARSMNLARQMSLGATGGQLAASMSSEFRAFAPPTQAVVSGPAVSTASGAPTLPSVGLSDEEHAALAADEAENRERASAMQIARDNAAVAVCRMFPSLCILASVSGFYFTMNCWLVCRE